jgi:hypothetical protein
VVGEGVEREIRGMEEDWMGRERGKSCRDIEKDGDGERSVGREIVTGRE